MKKFMQAVTDTLDSDYNVSVTENGAIGFKTTGKSLLDLNFSVGSLRAMDTKDIENLFLNAYTENPPLAIKFLFYLRDIRGGLGERVSFRKILMYLSKSHPFLVKELIPFIPNYGRYDDLWILLDTPLQKDVIAYIKKVLNEDKKALRGDGFVSLLGKWLPSENASSSETKKHANKIIKGLHITPRQYRKTLSKLRAKIKIVETFMTKKEWGKINYEAVPSRANLIYNKAFLRNDEIRRRKYLDALESGETKINAAVLFPYDIAHSYRSTGYIDEGLEAMWKALPDYVKGDSSTLVVADGSGSMDSHISGNSKVTAHDVADSLAIYFAEKLKGQFHNQYITFSSNPQLVDFKNATSLRDKLNIAEEHDECSNTDIEKTFDLILRTAVENNLSQDDLPNNILIISDMEFDSVTYTYPARDTNNNLFKKIKLKWGKYNYKLPKLIFWNVNSRTETIPMKENTNGVMLVSGFSVAVAKVILSNELDPYKYLVSILSDSRYNFIDNIPKENF